MDSTLKIHDGGESEYLKHTVFCIVVYSLPWPSLAQTVKNLPAVQETWIHPWVREGPLEEGLATYSRIAWRIPWTWWAIVLGAAKSQT